MEQKQTQERPRSAWLTYQAAEKIVAVTIFLVGVIMMMAVLPPLLLGTWIGWQLYGKLDDRRFRQALAVLLIISGLTLVI